MEQVVGIVTVLETPFTLTQDVKKELYDIIIKAGLCPDALDVDEHPFAGGYILEDHTVSLPLKQPIHSYRKYIRTHDVQNEINKISDKIHVGVYQIAYVRVCS